MSFIQVVKDIRELIPDKTLKDELNILYTTFCYRAPELMNNSVLDLHAFLKKNVDSETSWGKQIQKMWNDFVDIFNRDRMRKKSVHDCAVSFVDNMCNDIVTEMVSTKIE